MFQIGEKVENWKGSGRSLDIDFGVCEAVVLKFARHHLLFKNQVFGGESGTALALHDGLVIGLHQAGLNEAKERQRKKTDGDDPLTEAESSVASVVKWFTQGHVGVLSSTLLSILNGVLAASSSPSAASSLTSSAASATCTSE